MIIKDLLICDDFSYIKNSNIVIYGTGVWGKKVYHILKKSGAEIISVCNTEANSNNVFYGHRILSIAEIKEKHDEPDVLIIIASTVYFKEMVEICEQQGFASAKVCTLYAFYLSLFMHYEDETMPEGLHIEIKNNLIASEKRIEYWTKIYAFEMMLKAVEEGSVLIYQPGKVGSQSVWNTISGESIQFHSLVIPYGCREFPKEQLDYYLCQMRSKTIKIIAGVREPISRDLAAMFQNSELDLWPFCSANSNIFWWYGDYLRDSKKKLDYKEIARRSPGWKGSLEETFLRLSESIMENGLDEFTWFRYEIESVFNIDIFKEPFDREKGYGIIKKGNVEILIYKLEKLTALESVIGRFIGMETYRLEKKNLSENKMYYYAYKELKEKVKISGKYFQYYYGGNTAFRHFYTDKEISEYRITWGAHVDEFM